MTLRAHLRAAEREKARAWVRATWRVRVAASMVYWSGGSEKSRG